MALGLHSAVCLAGWMVKVFVVDFLFSYHLLMSLTFCFA